MFGQGATTSVLFIDTLGCHGVLLRGTSSKVQMELRDFGIRRYNTGQADGWKLLYLIRAKDFTFRDLDVQGSTGFSFAVQDSANGEIHDNTVHDSVLADGADGIHVVESCDDIRVHHNHVHHTGDDGISIGTHTAGVLCSKVVVEYNTVEDVRCNGIKVHEGSREVDVRHNNVRRTWLSGIIIEVVIFGDQDARDVSIHDNTVIDSAQCDCGEHGAICVADRNASHPARISDFSIYDNTIQDALQWGILVVGKAPHYVENGIIQNNSITNWDNGEITLIDTVNVVVQ